MVKLRTSEEKDNLTINRVKINSLTFYEITEEELEKLETGGFASIFLNFSIFTISVAVSFFIALLTSEMSDKIFIIFLTITIICFLAGIILFILWKKTNKSVKKIIKKIRDRKEDKENDEGNLFDNIEKFRRNGYFHKK